MQRVGRNEALGLAVGLLVLVVGRAEARVPLIASTAGTPESTRPSDEPSAAAREETAQRQAAVQRALDMARAEGSSPPDELVRELDLLKQIQMLESQRLAAKERETELTAQHQQLEAKVHAARLAAGAARQPASFLVLDQMRDELNVLLAREESVRAEVSAATDAVERAKRTHEERQRRRRQLRETVDSARAKKPEVAPSEDMELALVTLESRAAGETVALREAELANERLAEQNHRLQVTLLREQIDRLAVAPFTADDLQVQLDQLERTEAELQREMELAQDDAEYSERRWLDAQQRLERAGDLNPVLVEEVEAWRLARLTDRRRVALAGERLAREKKNRTSWRRRYDLTNQLADGARIALWQREAQRDLDEVERENRLQRVRIDDLRKDLATLEGRQRTADAAADGTARWIGEQRHALERLIKAHEANIVSLEAGRRLSEKLLAELRGGQGVQQASSGLLTTAWASVASVWDYEITSIDDRPITVRKVFTVLVLIVLGFIVASWVSRTVGRRLLPKMHVHQSAAAALQSIIYYVLLLMFAMVALQVLNVPLTAFTIVGGAVALGIGFGSQNIINNFISGLILLAERPVRVGDLIQLDGLMGTVERIGARSTRIKTGNNFEIIIPNSSFLQNNVINWTLSDDKIRTSVNIGVAYGTPTRELTRLLRRAAEEHGLVLDNPEPFVWFTEFGDNALQFELHFWLQMRSLSERRRIESDIRYRIDHLLRDANITIAFPQRDVHLDTARPLDVRVVSSEPSAASVRDAA